MAMNLAAHKQISISFSNAKNGENIVSRWKSAATLASKVGKGFLMHNKSQLLNAEYWLEAIDPLHRYGKNLNLYYVVWFNSQSSEPFLHWLDFGDGKEIDLKESPRTELLRQRILYPGLRERQKYEVIARNKKLVYKHNGAFVHTTERVKWICVFSPTKSLFVGEKEKGLFQHSSFLSGGAAVAAGRLIVHDGILQAIWAYSGHYCPKEDNFAQMIQFLGEQQVDLENVKMFAIDDDVPPIPSQKSECSSS